MSSLFGLALGFGDIERSAAVGDVEAEDLADLHLNRSILFCSVMLCASLFMAVLVRTLPDGAFASICHCANWLHGRFPMNGW